MLNVVGFRCAVCAATVDVATPLPWRCPRALGGDRHHVLQIVRRMAPLRPTDDPNPFVSYDVELAWAAFAEAHGMTADARTALVRELDDAVRAVDGTGFRVTPFARSDALSDELGFADRRWRVGQGRDRQRRREPQGTPPVHGAVAPAGRRVARARAMVVNVRGGPPPAGDRLVRQRRAGRGDARPRRGVADRGVRAGLGRSRGRRPPHRTGRGDHHLRATRRRSAGRPDRAAVP